MADTLGGVVDKLIVTNIKLWFTQAVVHDAAKAGEGVDAETVAKLHSLNLTRNRLMTEVDMLLADAVHSGEVEVDPRFKLT